jgi:hypothetical protein
MYQVVWMADLSVTHDSDSHRPEAAQMEEDPAGAFAHCTRRDPQVSDSLQGAYLNQGASFPGPSQVAVRAAPLQQRTNACSILVGN